MTDANDAIKSLNQARYSQHAAGYVTSTTHAQGDELAHLLDLAQPQADWRVLDVATGGGHTALKFAPHVAQVIATDLTPTMLKAARDFISTYSQAVQFSAADGERLPFPSTCFDLVTCRIAAHHFPDVWRFVGECARVLKVGGGLLIQDHVLPEHKKAARYVDGFERLRDPSHVRAFNEYEWRGILLDHDLHIAHSEIILKRHTLLDWAKRQGCDALTLERLQVMLLRAPQPVQDHMLPEYAGTDYATFCNRHIILLGRKTH